VSRRNEPQLSTRHDDDGGGDWFVSGLFVRSVAQAKKIRAYIGRPLAGTD